VSTSRLGYSIKLSRDVFKNYEHTTGTTPTELRIGLHDDGSAIQSSGEKAAQPLPISKSAGKDSRFGERSIEEASRYLIRNFLSLSRRRTMRIFWWQGGLHFEPETAEEGKAMRLLYGNASRTTIGAGGEPDVPKSSDSSNASPAGSCKKTVEDIVTNQ